TQEFSLRATCVYIKIISLFLFFLSGSCIVGYAMYYFTYDPWIGKLLYLEDFYVMEPYRGLGIGSEILKRLSQVFIWNKPSIEYYVRRGALDLSTEEGWHLFRFDKENLLRMASGE
uniref:N-acetyltransferase domain-containing protein n=1 Tax=Gopherus evgoodei TaxID=1825980 RepID=A0A8C4Y9H5_9SAUR